MLITLSQAKQHLAVASNDHDDFLISQIIYLSQVIEGYCGRVFASTDYKETLHFSDFERFPGIIVLSQYPVIEISGLTEDGIAIAPETYRIHKPSGTLTKDDKFFVTGSTLEIFYRAGYLATPLIVEQVLLALLSQRFNKKLSGVQLDFGTDVQSVSIPGVINIQFDYSLDFNQRKNAFGSIVGSYSNALDVFRSERMVVGSGRLQYVDKI